MLATALFALLAACSSALDLAGTTSVYCSAAGKPATSCTVITGPSAGDGTIQSECTSNGGEVVDACPMDGVVGCCTTKEQGVTTEMCSYVGKASELKTECQGLFTTTL
jgi:hypothetical protein